MVVGLSRQACESARAPKKTAQSYNPDGSKPPCQGQPLMWKSDDGHRQYNAPSMSASRDTPVLSPQNLARDSRRRSFPPRTAPDSLPTQRTHPPPGEKTNAHRSSRIHETDIPPINCVPPEQIPVNVPPDSMDAVKVTKICDKQTDKQGAPNPQI